MPELTEDNIQGATLNLLCNFKDVQGIIQELVEFAAGQADGTNRADMERNRDKLLALASASITLLFADKEGYREGTQND
ncbi:MAG: hypothetical protein IJ731_06800 [Eubacterium sp.]|nr:hypothetical protein [Eubacterium sp.]